MGLVILRAGLLTTVQDLGRWGYQHYGVPVAGAMDTVSHRLANLLVGNPGSAATLEVTVNGPELRFDAPTVFAVTGARFGLSLDGAVIDPDRACEAGPKQTLTFGARQAGARAYLAVAGGVAVPQVLGSRSTHVASGMGGLAGRALRAGDRVGVGTSESQNGSVSRAWGPVTPLPLGGVRVRILEGPDTDVFGPEGISLVCATRYRVAPESNRMGYRLQGKRLKWLSDAEPLSCAIPLGAIQVPASGEPILLLADHQTVGGYPRVATVISADLPVLGQLMVSDWIEFETCSHEAARDALVALEQKLIA